MDKLQLKWQQKNVLAANLIVTWFDYEYEYDCDCDCDCDCDLIWFDCLLWCGDFWESLCYIWTYYLYHPFEIYFYSPSLIKGSILAH